MKPKKHGSKMYEKWYGRSYEPRGKALTNREEK